MEIHRTCVFDISSVPFSIHNLLSSSYFTSHAAISGFSNDFERCSIIPHITQGLKELNDDVQGAKKDVLVLLPGTKANFFYHTGANSRVERAQNWHGLLTVESIVHAPLWGGGESCSQEM